MQSLNFYPGRQSKQQVESVLGHPIEPADFAAYTQRRGELAHEQVARMVGLDFFAQLPPDKQVARIKQAFTHATTRARREILGNAETQAARRERLAEAASQ